MSYEELVVSRKNIGDMTKEELFTYCGGLLSEVWDYEKENEQLHNKVEELMELYTTERHCKDDYKAIINELERYINEEYIYDELGMKIFDASKLQEKLQELKESDSNVKD